MKKMANTCGLFINWASLKKLEELEEVIEVGTMFLSDVDVLTVIRRDVDVLLYGKVGRP